MKKTIISMALLALIGVPGAIAQSGSKGTSVGSTINGTVPEAPVGHRQPRASDVPNATSDVPNDKNSTLDLLAKENANLDKKIKSICRGC
jgi:peptidoglycan hydrolase CwlO-like protein